jgi:hypothetical protein
MPTEQICVTQLNADLLIILYLYAMGSQALVAHACNSSYSGGRDQEDHGSKPALCK